jgi:hypothetical protein
MLAGGCGEDTFEQPEVIARVGEPMNHEAEPNSVAADEAMRKKLGDPAWQRPKGYVWNHPGGPDSTIYELVERRMHAAIALSCEFPGPREIAPAVGRSSPASAPDGGTAAIQSAYDRYCQERFSSTSEARVSALEQKIGVVLPDDYRRFVLEFNGGYFNEPEITAPGDNCPRDVLTFLCGLGASHEEAELGSYLPLFADNDPPKVVPIGGTALGALIVIDTAPGDGQGAIYLKPAFDDYHYLAPAIEAFFRLLRKPTSD